MRVVVATGAEGLCRVIGVVALYGLTADRLEAQAESTNHLLVRIRLNGDADTCMHCADRIRALVCVLAAELREVGNGHCRSEDETWIAETRCH